MIPRIRSILRFRFGRFRVGIYMGFLIGIIIALSITDSIEDEWVVLPTTNLGDPFQAIGLFIIFIAIVGISALVGYIISR